MKNKVFLVGMFGIMLVFGIMIIGCKEPEPEHEPKTKIIKYQVTSTWSGVRADIQYDGGPSSDYVFSENVPLPWEVTVSASYAYIRVSPRAYPGFSYDSSKSMTVKIFIDGIEVRSSTVNKPQPIVIDY